MKAKRNIIIAALALVMGTGASAQEFVDFGIKAGASLNMMPWTTLDVGDRLQPNFGFYGGGYVAVNVSEYWFIQTDVMYARKGVSTSSNIQGKYSRNISYLQIPLYVGWNITGSNDWLVMTGPGLGIYLGESIKYESPGAHPSSVSNEPQPLNLFWALQGNYALTDSFLIEVRADIGLTKTFKPGGLLNDDKGRNASFSLGVCYRFGY